MGARLRRIILGRDTALLRLRARQTLTTGSDGMMDELEPFERAVV
jgi:hypothetical protein